MKTKKRISRAYSYILHQIINERRSNWALLAELLIVSSIVWYLVDSAYIMIVRAMEPTGFDTTNCYRVEIGAVNESSTSYDAGHPVTPESKIEDMWTLADRIKHDEDVEAVAFSVSNDPYQGSSMSTNLTYDTITTNIMVHIYEPDFLRVFRIHGINGESPEKLAKLLKDRNVFISENALGGQYDLKRLIGKKVATSVFDTLPHRIAAIIPDTRRFTWEESFPSGTMVLPFSDEFLNGDFMVSSLSIRVKDSRAEGFAERFGEKIKNKKMREGNFYVSGFNSYDKLRADSEFSQDTQMRFYTIAMVFLLVNVFLGLLGTFWFRTQRRFPEIGLQKAIGATNTDITLRLLCEAVALMTAAFAVSLVIDVNIAYARLTTEYYGETLTAGRFAACAAISYVLMLAIVCLGIWFPALKAVKAEPVEVLRGE